MGTGNGPSNKPNGQSKPNAPTISDRSSISDQLIPEALGFEPLLVLDDVFNIGQAAVVDTIQAMENYLARWPVQIGNEEVEQGLVSLQTLLESHVDTSIDLFEVWARRNTLNVPEEVMGRVVLPHQKGLDLRVKEGREGELLAEVEELRRRKENMLKLNAEYARAVEASSQQLELAQSELAQVQFISSHLPALSSLATLPEALDGFQNVLSAVPTSDEILAMDTMHRLQYKRDTRRAYGKRDWEDREGYVEWALERVERDDLDRMWREKEAIGGNRGTMVMVDIEGTTPKVEEASFN